MTDGLADFLLARTGEDEAVAWEARDRPGGDTWADSIVVDDGVRNPAIAVAPARLLAECEAKRRIVELHRDYGDSWPDIDHACTECGAAGEFPVAWPCPTLRLLALPYAGHPDYRQEWAP